MEKEYCLEAVAKDEHGSGLDRIGSGLKPILTRSGPVMATWSRSLDSFLRVSVSKVLGLVWVTKVTYFGHSLLS